MNKHALAAALTLALGVATAPASPLVRPDPGLPLAGADTGSGSRASGLLVQQDDLLHRVAGRRCDRKYFSCIGGRRYRCEVLGRVDAFGRCVPYAQRCSRTGGSCR